MKSGNLFRFGISSMVAVWGCASSQAVTSEPLDEVVVTARAVIDSNSVDSQSGLTTVVTEAQLRDLNALDLSSALRRTPGVAVSRFNPVGSFGGSEGGAVYVRGLGASRPGSEIKTYIDGVPFYMAVWSHPLLDLLPVNAVQSVSVHKGPQPHSSGNNFSSIELTTRRAANEGMNGDFTLAGGSFGTFVERVDVTGKSAALDYSFAQSYASSNGHRDDADGKLSNIMGHAGYALNEHWSVSATALVANNRVSDPGQTGNPSSKTGRYDTKGNWVATELRHQFDSVTGSLQLYANSGDGNWLDQPVDGDTLSHFNLSGLRWREQITPWKDGEVLWALDVDCMSGDVDFNHAFRFNGPTLRITSPYLGLSQRIALGNRFTLLPSAGVRYYDHNVLASKSAPQAGVQLLSSSFDARVTASRGISYPGLDAAVLSSLISALGDSWRKLDPEQLDHVEAGVTVRPAQGSTIDLAVFKDRLKHRYVFAFPFPPAVTAPAFVNLGSYDIDGIELSWQQQLTKNWDTFVGYTYFDPSLQQLPYAPKQSLSLGSNVVLGKLRLSVDAQHQNAMYVLEQARANGAVNSARVDAFTVVNMRLAYSPRFAGKRGQVYLAVENLFDADYAYRPGYPMPGASGQLGLSLGW